MKEKQNVLISLLGWTSICQLAVCGPVSMPTVAQTWGTENPTSPGQVLIPASCSLFTQGSSCLVGMLWLGS